jgi:hypothetical protein
MEYEFGEDFYISIENVKTEIKSWFYPILPSQNNFNLILIVFEFLHWIDTLNIYWFVKLYNFIILLIVLIALHRI